MATVQATCPGCQNRLNFPAEWAGKALKCKKCGAVVQTYAKAAEPPPLAVPARAVPARAVRAHAVPVIVVAPAAAADDFSALTDAEFASPATNRYRKPSGGVGAFGALAALALIAGTLGLGGFLVLKNQRETANATTPGTTSATKPTIASAVAPFPRRLLFVNVSRYAFMNPLTSGTIARGDAATDAAKKLAFEWRVPTDGPGNQFYLLSDAASKDAPAVTKSLLRPTIETFLETSRPQDRVAIYFGGHAIEKDGKAYLCPSDGDPDDADSLLPLDAVYEKMKACPAQQKFVIWDVCRFNPQLGRVLPGSEPMGETLHKLLTTPPPGVQVWVTCSANENAVELPKSGSEFLAAVRTITERGQGPKTGTGPDDPIPAEDWRATVQKKLDQFVQKDGKPNQTMSLAGTAGAAVAYDPDEPLPARFAWPKAPPGADPVAVAAAFNLIDLPALRSDKALAAALSGQGFPVPADALKDYLTDKMSLDEAKAAKDSMPIRAAAASAILKMRAVWKGTTPESGGLRERFVGQANDRVKKAITAEQETPARIILELESIIDECDKLEKDLDKEPSKRWRATFQYALAQAKARWVYMNEYNLMLGVINKNELPPIDEAKGQTGWQMVSTEKMKSKKEIRDKADAAQELFAKIATEHKGTPWAVLAKQAKNVKLGLDWRVVTPGEDKGE